MHVADTGIHTQWAALPRPRVSGRWLPIGLIAGITWLAMMGAVVSSYVLGHPLDFVPASYTAYADITTVAPTSYGSLAVTRADVSTDAGIVTARFTLVQVNATDSLAESPQIEELWLVDASGRIVSKPVPDTWNGPAFLPGHGTATIVSAYEAPADAGPLWLVYQNVRGQHPIRFALPTGASR